MFDWLLYSLFLASLAVVIYRLVDLVRAPRRPAMWAMWSGLLMLTLCVAVGLPLWPRSSVGFIVQHVLILGCLAAFELFYLLSIYGGRRRPTSTIWFRGTCTVSPRSWSLRGCSRPPSSIPTGPT